MGVNHDISTPHWGAEALLRDLVYERTGLFFDDSKLDLFAGKISPLIEERGFNSLLDYYYLLKYDADSAGEWNNVVDTLTVRETYFWREMDQIHGLAGEVVPQLLKLNGGGPVRIWSAACATGEEPLTIAMRLNEDGWFDRARIEIHASDASCAAIERARRGVYGGRSFRALPHHLKEKYFTPDGKNWRVSPEIHEKISWSRANLIDSEAVRNLASVPVIFCRNVFIYFSADAVRRVVESFAQRMDVPGFLFVGAAESLLKVTDQFELEEAGNAFVYVKRK
jgi:chemotaxis protein methyltransferase CheR